MYNVIFYQILMLFQFLKIFYFLFKCFLFKECLICYRNVQQKYLNIKKSCKETRGCENNVQLKIKKNNFKVIFLNVACYKQYADYFKTTFPYTAPPTYKERAINICKQIDSDS